MQGGQVEPGPPGWQLGSGHTSVPGPGQILGPARPPGREAQGRHQTRRQGRPPSDPRLPSSAWAALRLTSLLPRPDWQRATLQGMRLASRGTRPTRKRDEL